MLRFAPVLAIAIFAVWTAPTLARFARVEVEKVPVERLAKNLEESLKKDPKNGRPF
ncbi:MAG: hypothetical protein U0792_20310 [Gemmataceae bacterium]